jgi:hypothetical protein
VEGADGHEDIAAGEDRRRTLGHHLVAVGMTRCSKPT